jgi:proteasome assembly chaperone (PAC2) family protein
MQPLIWESRPDGLRAPAMIVAFSGWNDAGDAASAALTFMGESLGAERFARLDPEEFYDFQSTRPQIGFTDERKREITWPGVEMFAARVPRAQRDLILVQGPEPSMRWKTFCQNLVDLAEALGTQLVVTMGALLADRLAVKETTYEGPTGIVGVLHTACMEAGLPSASLWAAVPHYVAAAPNPKAALALVRKIESLVAVTVDATELETATGEYERQVGLAVQSDPDVQAFVERLEQAAERDTSSLGPGDLPSGDAIASEFQRFLRQQGPPDR